MIYCYNDPYINNDQELSFCTKLFIKGNYVIEILQTALIDTTSCELFHYSVDILNDTQTLPFFKTSTNHF